MTHLTLLLILTAMYFFVLWIYVYKKYKSNKILYRFCQIRRELISLLHHGKINTNSVLFDLCYKLTSLLIHYPKMRKFNTSQLLVMLNVNEDFEKVNIEFRRELEKAPEEVRLTISRLLHAILLSYYEKSFLLYLFYWLIMSYEVVSSIFMVVSQRFNLSLFQFAYLNRYNDGSFHLPG